MSVPVEELLVLLLLLVGVVGIYYALKLHYHIAFALVKNTSLSKEKKQKIEKIKTYVFIFLKVLLILGLSATLLLSVRLLIDGVSLKKVVLDVWEMIPDGFWEYLFWTLLRIAILIVVLRYILKKIYRFLDKEEKRTIAKKRYNRENIQRFYLRVHNTVKYTVILGILYRIVHFFPFLEKVSYLFLIVLILFLIVSLGITFKEFYLMKNSLRFKIRK